MQEYILWTFVLGRVLVETQQIQRTRMTEYLSSMWNIVDIISLILFVAIIVMRIGFYLAFHQFYETIILDGSDSDLTVYNFFSNYGNISESAMVSVLRENPVKVPKIGNYTENDLLAVINVIYSINSIIACTRLLPLFEASYSLGPLQLTMGGMLADLSKIMCLLLTVILAFSLGIAKLYNSRFYYLFVDGYKSVDGTPPILDDTDQPIYHTIRSIQCLYLNDQEPGVEILEANNQCSFNYDSIQPILFKR